MHHCVTFAIEYLETVRDRSLIPKDHRYEMANGKSNGYVTDDVT